MCQISAEFCQISPRKTVGPIDKLKCAISIICLAVVLVLVLGGQILVLVLGGQVLFLVLVLGGQVLVLVLGGQVLVLVQVLGGQVLVNIPALQKPTIVCWEFTILAVAQLGGIGDPTNCACTYDWKLRCRNGLLNLCLVRQTKIDLYASETSVFSNKTPTRVIQFYTYHKSS